MANLADVDLVDTGHHVLIYGPPKVGKTLLAGLAAAQFKIVWLDLEHGHLTLKQLPMDLQRNIELVVVPDNRKNYQAITTMIEITAGSPVKVCDMHGKVGTCAVCNLSKATGATHNVGTMVDINIEAAGPDTIFVMDSITQLSHSAMGKALGPQEADKYTKPEYGHYSGQGYFLDRVLTAIQNSRANWICISHEESLEQEDGRDKIVPVAGTRNFSKNSARYFDHVVHLKVENYKYSSSSAATDDMNVIAGSRTNVSLKNNPEAQGIISLLRSTKEAVVPKAKPADELTPALNAPATTGTSALDRLRAKAGK